MAEPAPRRLWNHKNFPAGSIHCVGGYAAGGDEGGETPFDVDLRRGRNESHFRMPMPKTESTTPMTTMIFDAKLE